MVVGATSPVSEHDPITAALNDSTVRERLLNSAKAILAGKHFRLSPAQRYHVAEEIVQRVSKRVWERRAEYDPSRDVVLWILGFVRNVCREYRKAHARETTGPPIEMENLAVDLGRDPCDMIADRAFVEHLLAKLDPLDRTFIEEKYTLDPTFAELGAKLSMTETAARVRHHRIIARLRELADREGQS
jgi:RNA polymerase sigma factor (sigma-70 family)